MNIEQRRLDSIGSPVTAARAPGRALQRVELTPAPARVTLSLVIPCYNEENTLEACVEHVVAIADETLDLELIIVDDCSKDRSLAVAEGLKERVPGLIVLHHKKN